MFVIGEGRLTSRLRNRRSQVRILSGDRQFCPGIASGIVLPDIIKPGLQVVFVGTSKSTASARAGHYYANRRNMFWNLLQATGLTGGEWIRPQDDATVLEHGV